MNAFTNADSLTMPNAGTCELLGSRPMRCSKGHKWDGWNNSSSSGLPDSIAFAFGNGEPVKGPFCIRCVAEWMEKNISKVEPDIGESIPHVNTEGPKFYLIWKDYGMIRIETLEDVKSLESLVDDLNTKYKNQHGFQILGIFEGKQLFLKQS